jgi:hypothetical protein
MSGRRLVLALLGCALAVASYAAAPTNPSLAGIWFPDPTRSERLPKDAPFTKEGKALVDTFKAQHEPTKDDPGLFCIPAGMPSIALGGADYPVEIIETPQQTTILMELHQQVRRIFVNGTHPAEVFPQRNGHSVGHWESNVFVVDTVGIRAASFGSVPHSNQVRVLERWQRIDEGRALVNEMTIHDPKMYTKPVVLRQYYKAAAPDSRMLEYECTEGRWVEYEKSRGITPD